MPPLPLAVAPCSAALYATLRPLSVRSAQPQALRRTWDTPRQRAAHRRAAASSDGSDMPVENAFCSSLEPVRPGVGSRSKNGEGAGGGEPLQLVRNRKGGGYGCSAWSGGAAGAAGAAVRLQPAALGRAVAAEGKPRQAGVVQLGAAVAA
ncbi:hypothetical protein ABPG77_009843 [Micractinium sp. CCAP 211/92]